MENQRNLEKFSFLYAYYRNEKVRKVEKWTWEGGGIRKLDRKLEKVRKVENFTCREVGGRKLDGNLEKNREVQIDIF